MIDFDNPPTMAAGYRGTIEVYAGTDGNWYWLKLARNHEPIADGAQGYSARYKAVKAADRANCADPTAAAHTVLTMQGMVLPWRVVIHDRDGNIDKIGALY